MKHVQKGKRIVWLIRTLTCLGLLMVVVTISLVGWRLSRVRAGRALATTEQARLNSASDELRLRAKESFEELESLLDETKPVTNQVVATEKLVGFILQQTELPVSAGMQAATDGFTPIAPQLVEAVQLGLNWRSSYDRIWEDLNQRRTLARVRAIIARINEEVDSLEGRRRLEDAIKYRRWRNADEETGVVLARSILEDLGRYQSRGVDGFNAVLAECARLVELLGGEEQIDRLADLKENKLKPVLDRLSRTSRAFVVGTSDSESSVSESIELLRAALFGQSEEAGSLFALRRDALLLRRDRKILKQELAQLFQEIDAANATFVQLAQNRAAALGQEMEDSLAASWYQMLYVGIGCSTLFLWLAHLISREIRSQVDNLERTRAEAVQENAERRQAEEALRKNEAQLKTIVENLTEGVAVADLQGRVVHLNRAALVMHGVDSPERNGKPLDDMLQQFELSDLHGSVLSDEAQPLSRILRGENLLELNVRARRLEDGWERIFCYRGSLVHDTAGLPLMAVVTISDITERKHAEVEMDAIHRKLLEASRQAGMAEVATGVLHNVGNVLNSVNVSANLIGDRFRKSKIPGFVKIVALIREHSGDLPGFFSRDERAAHVPGYLEQLAQHLSEEQKLVLDEVASLRRNIDHIKDIVNMQQNYAQVSGVTEQVSPAELIEDALRMNSGSLDRHAVEVVKEIEDAPPIEVDKQRVLQVLVNFVRNAKYACDESRRSDKCIIMRLQRREDRVVFSVVDNGVGISRENREHIFNHGFTTRKDGHGFGLHSSANAATELGGSVNFHSDGPGLGATFSLELPVKSRVQENTENTLASAGSLSPSQTI